MRSKPFTVCLTGGGTAGHVTPHFALLPAMRARGWQVFYIGSAGIEGQLVKAQGVTFYAVATGKLRRYASWRNAVDLLKVGLGCLEALWLLLRQRPDVLFSKGGFVAVPVAWAAFLLGIPVVSHESDVTPGLANRLIKPVARRLLYTFPETAKYVGSKSEQVGTPIRAELLRGDRARGLALCEFTVTEVLPTLLVMGGSQGAQRLNEALLSILPALVQDHRVIHLTGKGKGLAFSHPRYKGFEFVGDELKDLYAAADLVLSRAGANSLFELLALRRPMLLVPLEAGSRGDQVVNAASFQAQGWALVLREASLTADSLRARLTDLEQGADAMRLAQQQHDGGFSSAERIVTVLATVAAPS